MAIIIPARNAETTIGGTLEGLVNQTDVPVQELQVIVVLNRCSDGTKNSVSPYQSALPGLRVVTANEKANSYHARNVGASQADAEFLLFCDADDKPSHGWVRAIAEALTTGDMVGGSLALRFSEREAWFSPGGLPCFASFLPFVSGANTGIRADVLRELGGWNEEYENGGDVELSWRLQLSGRRLVYEPSAVIYWTPKLAFRSAARQGYKQGKAAVRLYRDFRAEGMPRPHLGTAVRAVLVAFATLVRPGSNRLRRAKAVKKIAHRVGRIVGSVKERVCFF
jgi:cellulose synthase/poly-beta-1,6-N-acetylglucosamine synthase-like glycosyltransferase